MNSTNSTTSETEEFIRKPAVAGRFYQQNAESLKTEINSYLEKAGEYKCECSSEDPGKPPMALMLPHAGHIFSGIVAGITLGQVTLSDTLLILCPNHTGMGNAISVWPSGEWLTPLGSIAVNQIIADDLIRSAAGFSANTQAHTREHSIEVLLPFFQVMQPDVKIVPVCVGEYDREKLERAGLALADCIKKYREQGIAITMIGSTDMSHHIPHDKAKTLDSMALSQIVRLNPEGLHQTVHGNKISMCGVSPVTMMLYACNALGAEKCCLTSYTNSGVTGAAYGAGLESVVGYAGAIII